MSSILLLEEKTEIGIVGESQLQADEKLPYDTANNSRMNCIFNSWIVNSSF